MEQTTIQQLLEQYLEGRLSESDAGRLRDLLNDASQKEEWIAAFHQLLAQTKANPAMVPPAWNNMHQQIVAVDKPLKRHVIPLYKRWLVAASVFILVMAGAYIWWNNSKPKQMVQPVAVNNDVAPGSNKAYLTLADGTKIDLDSAATGSLAQQGNAFIIKQADGQIVYQLKDNSQQVVMTNTMSTPRGGQYQLDLPDGTKVWLNAASSITYPVAFTGKKRNVSITGEAYFEVARNKEKPFVVDVDGKSSIEVLGTHFNVNSYVEEARIRTTLIEGSVQVRAGDRNALLKPGQQALVVLAERSLTVVDKVDIEQVLAWKNGTFNFQDMRFPEVARQLERWYDIEVIYKGKIPDIQFKGDMDRGVQLSEIVRVLAVWGIQCRIEGKKLIVE